MDDHPVDRAVDYRPGVVLLRIAVAAAARARAYADRPEDWSIPENKFREIDACIETMILVQAGLEGIINAELGDHPEVAKKLKKLEKNGWIDRWEHGAAHIAAAKGRRPGPSLPADLRQDLRELSTWRQFFVHNDTRSRKAFEAAVGLSPVDVPGACDAVLAERWIDTADRLLKWGSQVSGMSVPVLKFLWVSPFELPPVSDGPE